MPISADFVDCIENIRVIVDNGYFAQTRIDKKRKKDKER